VKTRLAFGLNGNIPHRQADEPLPGVIVEIWPVDDRRPIRIESLQERPAEQHLVRLAADLDWR